MVEWGKDDCFVEMFGPSAHETISWLLDDYRETIRYMLILPSEDRRRLFKSTFLGQKFIEVETAKPGDIAIGNFELAVGKELQFPDPWVATMDKNNLWRVRLMNCYRAVEMLSIDKVFRRCHS